MSDRIFPLRIIESALVPEREAWLIPESGNYLSDIRPVKGLDWRDTRLPCPDVTEPVVGTPFFFVRPGTHQRWQMYGDFTLSFVPIHRQIKIVDAYMNYPQRFTLGDST